MRILEKLRSVFGFTIDEQFKKVLIATLFVGGLLISNVVTTKLIMIGGLVLPGAALLYALLFLASDIYVERYGREEGQKLVTIGFIASVVASAFIALTQYMPVAPFAVDVQAAYEILLGTNFRIVMASMTAYYISQTWDVFIFSFIKKKTGGKKKWLRNNLSTMTSQLIDTLIFITIAFIGNVPTEILFTMLYSQYLFKFLVAALDTPIFYLLTREKGTS